MQWVVILYLVTPKSIFLKKVLLYKRQIFDSAVVLQDIKYMTILSIDSLKKKKKNKGNVCSQSTRTNIWDFIPTTWLLWGFRSIKT